MATDFPSPSGPYKHIELRPEDATLGAQVYGVDLKLPLPDAVFAEIESAWNKYAVLIFPGQFLDAEHHVAFTRRFGNLEKKINELGGNAAVDVMSNLDENGQPVSPDSALAAYFRGDTFWHTDSAFKPVPAKASLLLAQRVPATGGDTEFADMRAAYDALDDTRRVWLSERRAVHSYCYGQGLNRGLEVHTREELEALPPVQHPIVRVHPVTRRPSLYLGRYITHIVDEPERQSRKMLADLGEWACQPPRTFRYRWAVGDLALWDNRCVLHRGCGYPPDQARIMARTTVAGDTAANQWEL